MAKIAVLAVESYALVGGDAAQVKGQVEEAVSACLQC